MNAQREEKTSGTYEYAVVTHRNAEKPPAIVLPTVVTDVLLQGYPHKAAG